MGIRAGTVGRQLQVWGFGAEKGTVRGVAGMGGATCKDSVEERPIEGILALRTLASVLAFTL